MTGVTGLSATWGSALADFPPMVKAARSQCVECPHTPMAARTVKTQPVISRDRFADRIPLGDRHMAKSPHKKIVSLARAAGLDLPVTARGAQGTTPA